MFHIHDFLCVQGHLSHLCQILTELLHSDECRTHSLLQKLSKYVLIDPGSETVLSPGAPREMRHNTCPQEADRE